MNLETMICCLVRSPTIAACLNTFVADGPILALKLAYASTWHSLLPLGGLTGLNPLLLMQILSVIAFIQIFSRQLFLNLLTVCLLELLGEVSDDLAWTDVDELDADLRAHGLVVSFLQALLSCQHGNHLGVVFQYILRGNSALSGLLYGLEDPFIRGQRLILLEESFLSLCKLERPLLANLRRLILGGAALEALLRLLLPVRFFSYWI